MPTPCTNCVRFHYGPCRNPPRQCHVCGGINHIERYCPNQKNTIHYVRGEPLAGTAKWCEWHGLNDDPELKQRILQALKTTPGSAIHINGVCIYRGNDKHFSSNERAGRPRARTLEDRITRPARRFRSPGRVRRRSASRSLSPGRHGRTPSPYRGPPGYQLPVNQPRYRSRSPLRQRPRTPSPSRQSQYQARLPRYASGSNAVVFEARDRQLENCHPGNRSHQPRERERLTPIKFNLPPRDTVPRSDPPAAFNAPPPRTPLGQVSNNISKSDQTAAFNAPKPPPPPSIPRSESMAMEVDDPYFVLGIEKGASEAEILGAYQEQIYEIDLERMTEGAGALNSGSVWNESIKILNAAKRQLLGY